jgi:hypothetical protein
MANTRGSKVIETVRHRHQIEADLFGMLEVASDSEFEERAGRIAGAGRDVIPVILRNLDTPNRRMLGALGRISTYLDSQEISLALRNVAGSRRRSDRERVGALFILERFLDEEVEDELFEGLANPEEVAIQSFAEMLDEAERTRLVLLDYLKAIDEQPVDVVLSILEALERTQGERMVEPLRLLAQDSRATVAKQALQALGRLRTLESGRALQCLVNGPVESSLCKLAERSLRKLKLCGVDVRPLPQVDADWRCLISPVDGEGNQSVWFMHTVPGQTVCCFLNVVLNDSRGVVDAIGDDQAQARVFPVNRRKGALHVFALSDAPVDSIVMEADFDYGRQLVRRALPLNAETHEPLPLAYRLCSDYLWGYDVDGVSTERCLPHVTEEAAAELLPFTGTLLDHVAFAAWYSADKLVYRQAMRSLCQRRSPAKRNSVAWLQEIMNGCFDSRARARCASQLAKMSEWLLLLGDEWTAEMALAASMTLQEGEAANHPFLARLVERGVTRANEDLQRDREMEH